MVRKYLVPSSEEGRRIDRLIRDWWPSVGMGLRMGAIRRGEVRIDGRRVHCSHRLSGGEELLVPWDMEPLGSSAGQKLGKSHLDSRGMPEWVIHWDDRLMVVNKPKGWICQPGGTGNSLPEEVWRLLGVRSGPVPAHRLDVNTSGVVLVPLDKALGREICRMFRLGMVEKVYWAVVKGVCQGPMVVDAPLLKGDDGAVRVSMDGQRALSVIRPVSSAGGWSLVEVELKTGRQHQARVHLAHVGLPILGDPRYGVRMGGVSRPMLHALRVRLPGDPCLGDLSGASFEAPPPEDMVNLIGRLGIKT